jgi:hypothetical protein
LEESVRLQAPAALPSIKEPPGAHFIEGWVDPKAVLDIKKLKFMILPGLLSHPACSQSLGAVLKETVELLKLWN